MMIDTNSAKILDQHLKMHEDSEVLLSIFNLFNLLYEKFNQSPEEDKQKIVKQIEEFYS